ncbi:hypothetical protein JOQ06_023138 [Pogonophryne albipinna]|uniref:Uncharacterized protein n=1 Tax=Pogonophryne albipinna TaxID=1090488 RepID=A0AAD6FU08_9TELE|nr:hypothetical protein JOQ06_023138 [Pogonophryne albipinna]
MKLTDMKKLRVAELRSRLKDLGLDNKGLKAELLGKLWSALEARPSQQYGDEKEDKPNLLNCRPMTPLALPETVDTHPPSPSPPTGVLTDTATQAETPPGLPSPQHVSAESVVSGCQVGEGEVEHLQGGAEGPEEDRGALPSEESMSKGRAFYEFKEEIRYVRAKSPQPAVDGEETEEESEDEVRLNPYDGHLHFKEGPDGACGQPRFWARFPSLWSGCRLTHGVLQGRVGFEVRLEKKLLTTQLQEQEDVDPCGLRVGWSVAHSSLLLGVDELSFAYDARGKKVSGAKEEEFGEPFSVGDIVGCYASFSSDGAVELSFHKNGRLMGQAFCLDASLLLARPLFPHVLCKGCSVRFLLDPTAPPWYPGPPGFTPLAALSAGQRERAALPPTSRAQGEVLLMVGLPGSGKSHWAQAHMKQHPEKQYRLLGTEELLASVISSGQRESWLQQASQCLTDLIKMASQTPGNYILDQSNILFSARRYKLQLFTGFRRRVVVVVPSADEWKRRLSLHRTSGGEQIPETPLLKLQVMFRLPEQESQLQEELQYVELPQEQAQALLQELRTEAQRLLPPSLKQEKKPRLHRKRPHPHRPAASHRLQSTGCHGWNRTRPDMQPWRQQPRYWSGPYQQQGSYYRDSGYGGYC